ncbi:MAG: hypothetical protein J4N76_09230 [Chloroflexi bacterium]|nr:hypothetical protein [Chloroflexota bacterium]MCI0773324.1 hypothetical protein [Chloroflexota bacterium]MCI0807104.1 hypothetical protein [Chloroflexota bacterium]MCI0862335.1 hypothetical protein [Chloroflexota bacterium]MCI0876731.1 hypothetical protein [Chloroflexota bacterium]
MRPLAVHRRRRSHGIGVTLLDWAAARARPGHPL